ncbi:MAG: DUF192 domain-containing protein [Woeseiaceae bacterium]|nr:DUF192 domain-containing protein [Woeseiaceae bacterium]
MKRLLLLLLLVPLCSTAQEDAALDENFGKANIIIVATAPACYNIEVYVAANFEQRRRGLMFVRELPGMTGMLFVYDGDDYLSMWMKNTFIPLDMVFIRSDGTIANIETDTEPQSLKSVSAVEPVRFVLELNAGATEALGIDTDSYLLL